MRGDPSKGWYRHGCREEGGVEALGALQDIGEDVQVGALVFSAFSVLRYPLRIDARRTHDLEHLSYVGGAEVRFLARAGSREEQWDVTR